jgi:hypothetical protein
VLRVRMRQLTVCQPKVSVPTVGSHCDRMLPLATHHSAVMLQVEVRSDCRRSWQRSLPLLSLAEARDVRINQWLPQDSYGMVQRLTLGARAKQHRVQCILRKRAPKLRHDPRKSIAPRTPASDPPYQCVRQS